MKIIIKHQFEIVSRNTKKGILKYAYNLIARSIFLTAHWACEGFARGSLGPWSCLELADECHMMLWWCHIVNSGYCSCLTMTQMPTTFRQALVTCRTQSTCLADIQFALNNLSRPEIHSIVPVCHFPSIKSSPGPPLVVHIFGVPI